MIFAYLDPGTGSLILQAVVGGLAGIGVAWKAWRSKVGRGGKSDSGQGESIGGPIEEGSQHAEP
jgi:hypothetical protein